MVIIKQCGWIQNNYPQISGILISQPKIKKLENILKKILYNNKNVNNLRISITGTLQDLYEDNFKP